MLEVEGVSNIVHRDNCFLSTVDTGPSVPKSSPATRYLDSKSYASENGLVGDMHPYAFSAKVRTHTHQIILHTKILCAFQMKRGSFGMQQWSKN